MTEFCQKLKAKGFTSIGSENNLALFMGDFTAVSYTHLFDILYNTYQFRVKEFLLECRAYFFNIM